MPSLAYTHIPSPPRFPLRATEDRLNALASEFSKLSAEFTKQSDRLEFLEQSFAEFRGAAGREASAEVIKDTVQIPVKSDLLQEAVSTNRSTYRLQEVASNDTGPRITAQRMADARIRRSTASASDTIVRFGTVVFAKFKTYDSDRTELSYRWEETLWDVSVFIGSSQLSMGGSLATLACLVLYLFLVSVYIIECWHTFTTSQFDEDSKRDFQVWRSTVGHDVHLRDVLTGESLVSKVCNDNFASPYSNFQLMVAHHLKEYLDLRRIWFGWSAGSVMVSLALCFWLLTLTIEVRKILEISTACLGLKLGWRSCFLRDDVRKSVFRLTTISYGRLVYVFLTLALRVSIVFVLGWVGISFLTHTTDLQDMLLDAVALEHILNLDELLFAALLPKRPRTYLHRIAPISYNQRFPRWNTSIQFVVFSVILAAIYYATVQFCMNPFSEILWQNLDALCGGREHGSYDFVVLVDSIGIPWAAATPSAQSIAQEDLLGTYAQHAIRRMQRSSIESALYLPNSSLWPKHRNNTGLFMQVPSSFDLIRLETSTLNFGYPKDWSIVTVVQSDALVGFQKEFEAMRGFDLGSAPGTVFIEYVRYLLRDQNATCDQVPLHRCYQYGPESVDVVFRQLCPHRCGCASPDTGSASIPHSNMMPGCTKMNMRSKPFVQRLQTLSCKDTSSRAVFIEWVQGVGDAPSISEDGLMLDALVSAFDTGGCSAAVRIAVTPLTWICEESSLSAICPQSCGCDPNITWTDYHARNMDFCPYSCVRSADEPCLTVKVDYHNQSYTNGPWQGLPCTFPFLYKNQKYEHCTDDDWMGPWCAVTVDEDRFLLLWGDCDPNKCPG